MSLVFLLILNFLSPVHADSSTSEKYNIEMSCYCNIYNDDGILINPKKDNKIQLDQFGLVFGSKSNVGEAEAILCKDNMLGDITQSCAGAFSRVIGSCRTLALPYSSQGFGANNFSVDTSTCFQNVELIEE